MNHAERLTVHHSGLLLTQVAIIQIQFSGIWHLCNPNVKTIDTDHLIIEFVKRILPPIFSE